jgi:hypothetical protein
MSERTKARAKASEARHHSRSDKAQYTNPVQSRSVATPFDHVLFVQRTIGNQAALALLQRSAISKRGFPAVKGTCTGSEGNKVTLQAKQVSDQTPRIAADIQTKINPSNRSGQPLPNSVRAFFELRLEHDFSRVRIQADATAAQSARALNARAYTVGRNIVFDAGQYAPDTVEGKRLLAHELTHTVQQQAVNVHNSVTSTAPTIQFQQYENCTPAVTDILPAVSQEEIDHKISVDRELGNLSALLAIDDVKRIRKGIGSATMKATFAKHFGSITPSQIKDVIYRFKDIATMLGDEKAIKCVPQDDSRCKGPKFPCAYVLGKGAKKIYLCPPFFEDPYPCLEADTIESLIHEAAHAAGASGHAYPKDASYPPTDAQDNAPSYSSFATDY